MPAFDKDRIVYMSPIKVEKNNTGRCNLKKGERYVIVCAPEITGAKGDFFLSVYFNLPLRDMQIKRIFHPEDK